MGFGLLFIGYLFTFRIAIHRSGFDLLPDIVGYLIMFAGMSKLALYNKGFRYAKLLLLPLVAAGGATLIFQTLGLTGHDLNGIFLDMDHATDLLTQMFLLAYHAAMFLGIRQIARETDLPKLAFRALRNFSITIFYYLAVLVAQFMTSFTTPGTQTPKYLSLIVSIIGILWSLLNLFLILSCYMRICLEGDEEMPYRPSRFRVLNRMNEKIDAALSKTERAGRKAEEYRRKKKKKKKKKK